VGGGGGVAHHRFLPHDRTSVDTCCPHDTPPPWCRAKNIKNEAKRNEDVNEQLIRQLREEIEALRKALEASKTGGGVAADGTVTSDADRARMEETIANLERAKQQSWCVQGGGARRCEL
jgi:tRNA(Glu) U13 pseudouridine synthase TruD